jgi:hypothetical protein
MWNIKTEVIPVIIRANKINSNSQISQKHTWKNHEIKALQKAAILALRT